MVDVNEVAHFLSLTPHFCDATLKLQDGKKSINVLVLSTYSKKIRDIVLKKRERETKIEIKNIKCEYFDPLYQFIYFPIKIKELKGDSEELAKALISSILFDSPSFKQLIKEILVEEDPVDVFIEILKKIEVDKLNFFADAIYRIYTRVINRKLFTSANLNNLQIKELDILYNIFPKYDIDIINLVLNVTNKKMMLIQLEVLKRKETIKSDYENNLYYLLDDVRIHNNVSNIGDRLWFIYVTNWFIYCPESKVNDCIVFLDLVTKYEDLCPFEVQNAINEYKNQRRIMTDEVNDDFIKYLKEIYKKVKSFNCTCENCLIFTVLSDDEEEINSMDVPKVMKDSNGKLYGKEYLNFCDSFEEKILLSTSKVDNSQNVSTFSMEIQTEDQTIYDDCRSVSLSSLRDKNSIYQPSSGLYIIGGRYEGKSSKENLIYFNPYDKMTVSMKDCFIDRIGCKAEYKDGKIFLFGGFNSNDEFCTRVKSLNVSSVDVGGKISELDLSLFCDRISHSTILINNDVYVIGGHMNDNSNEAIVKYDLSSETKSVIPVEDDFCVFGHILVEYNKAIYIVGGINQKSENVMTLFDPRDHNVLKKLTPSSIECFKSGVVLNGNIITSMGGLLHEIEHEREYVSDHVMHYDPRANNWIVDETPCLKPFYSGGVFQDGKKCFVFGGYDSNFSPQKVVQVYEKNEWKHSVDLDKPYADFGYVVAPY